MRVVTRKVGEAFVIGPDINISVRAIRGDRIKLAVKVPPGIVVSRIEPREELDIVWHEPAVALPERIGADPAVKRIQ